MKRSPELSTATATAIPTTPEPRDARDHTGREADLANFSAGVLLSHAVAGDKEVPGGIHGDTEWIVQLGVRRRPTVAAVSIHAIAGDRGDHTRGSTYFLDDSVIRVCDEKVPCRVRREPLAR